MVTTMSHGPAIGSITWSNFVRPDTTSRSGGMACPISGMTNSTVTGSDPGRS
ncbi:Uncharacterised protein [Mycobacteroides abscessus subsp. abscessus]|nr:Uncharacterised protein [Mycobacteroides abscessus subsp. abscessus]